MLLSNINLKRNNKLNHMTIQRTRTAIMIVTKYSKLTQVKLKYERYAGKKRMNPTKKK